MNRDANTYLLHCEDETMTAEIVLVDGAGAVARLNLPGDLRQIGEAIRRVRAEGYRARYVATLPRTIELSK
jgi:hypothetical protein